MRHLLRVAPFFITLIVLSFVFTEPALALQHIQGKKALDYVGDRKARFTNGDYSYEVLKRTHRDSMNGRFSDAVIFNPQGNQFLYVKRVNGNHELIVNHKDGRVENPVSSDPLVWGPLLNALNDDHPSPHVYLDDNGNEMAVVYIGPKTRLNAKITRDGLLWLRIKVKQVKTRRAGRR